MAFLDVFKALLLPFTIAGAIYALFAYLLIPLYRTHHTRYADYLPLCTLTSQTSSLRSRLQHSAARFLLPSFLRWRYENTNGSRYVYEQGESDEELFGAEEGEVMVGFDFNRSRGRLPVRDQDGRVVGEEELDMDSNRRLSRELEEGFKDESEDEERGGVDDRRR